VPAAEHVAARPARSRVDPPGRARRLRDGRGAGRPAGCRLRRGLMRALDAGLRRGLRSLTLAAAAVFLGLAMLVQLGVTSEAEWRVQRLAQAARTPVLEGPMEALSLLGTG